MKPSKCFIFRLFGTFLSRELVRRVNNNTTTLDECIKITIMMGLEPRELIYIAVKTNQRLSEQGEEYIKNHANLCAMMFYKRAFSC